MALSQADHFQAARQQLLNRRKEAEQEIREIDDALQGLDKTSRLISGKGVLKLPEHEAEKPATRTLSNRNVTALTREWLAEYTKYDTKIEINEIRDDLKRQGVKGKDRSLYSAIHVILKDEADEGRLSYKQGFGFFKSRERVDRLSHEGGELVHTSYSSL